MLALNEKKYVLLIQENAEFTFANRHFDLQLFAGEKTEEATDKRKREAIEKGNVAKSQDMGAVIGMLIGLIMLKNYGSGMYNDIALYMRRIFSFQITTSANGIGIHEAVTLFSQFSLLVLKVLVPLLFAIALGGIAVNIFQTGFILTFEPFMPKFDKLNPINGIQNLFTMKNVAEIIKSIIKIIVVAYVPYDTIGSQMPMFVRMIQISPLTGFGILGRMMFDMAFKILMILLILALADFKFQQWRHNEDMKMSKDEVKDEYKQQEGDPKVKQKIKEKQRQASQRKQMSEVPKATVVVTNPTHIAVAIKYEIGQQTAPIIVAMGAGLIAQKIKEIAAENDVPIVENKPLARALFKKANVGDEIPQEFWQTVVEILANVYRQKRQAA